jgi:hypothetical protein
VRREIVKQRSVLFLLVIGFVFAGLCASCGEAKIVDSDANVPITPTDTSDATTSPDLFLTDTPTDLATPDTGEVILAVTACIVTDTDCIETSPLTLDFGTIPEGQGATGRVRVTNTGTVPANLASVAIASDAFSATVTMDGTTTMLPAALALGASAEITITLAAGQPGGALPSDKAIIGVIGDNGFFKNVTVYFTGTIEGDCASGSADCDNDPTNGCETDLNTDASHCGACGAVCDGACVNGVCGGEQCPEGYDGDPCTDIDECENFTHDCSNNATCTNTDGSFECKCNEGFVGDGKICAVGAECTDNPCQNDSICSFIESGEPATECLAAQDTAGCPASKACEDAVCELDSFCCSSKWEGSCADCANGGENYYGIDCSSISPLCTGQGGTFCTCTDGWEGDVCDKDVDECEANQCDSLTECTNTLGGYACTDCPAGYTGDGKEGCVDINECDDETLNDCDENATCKNTKGSFACQCNVGFSGDGKTCAESDNCGTNPCLNGGVCSEASPSLCQETTGCGNDTCRAAVCVFDSYCCSGWDNNCAACAAGEVTTFADCTTMDDSCKGPGYACECPEGFKGQDCELVDTGDPCDPNPCQNDGTCSEDANGNTSCECPPAWTGDTCEKAMVDPCDPNPCQNEGTCSVDANGNTACECTPDWTGDTCEEKVMGDPCDPNPCQNGGSCKVDANGSAACECPAEWVGATCNTDADECANDTNNCDANATCTNTPGSFECACNPGYEGDGTTCTEVVTLPACLNMIDVTAMGDLDGLAQALQTCAANLATSNAKVAICLSSTVGLTEDCATCWAEFTDCSVNSCFFSCNGNEGSDACQNCLKINNCTSAMVECSGVDPADYLPTPTNPCAPNPCENGGICSKDANGNAACQCPSGWMGSMCSKDVDECTDGTNQCDPNATCTNTPGQYTCACNLGFEGDGFLCKATSKCTPNPCQNGGTCADANGLLCQDPPNCTNETCRAAVCELDSYCCNNWDGNCANCAASEPGFASVDCSSVGEACMGPGYVCECTEGFTGDDCEEAVVDPCDPNPCLNGGTCSADANGNTACDCTPEWTGDTCGDKKNPCDTNNGGCDVNAVCTISSSGLLSCFCQTGYEGDGKTCTDINECAAALIINPQNDPTCSACVCAADSFCCNNWNFLWCDACASGKKTNWCPANSCNDECFDKNPLNGCDDNATCSNTEGSFTCECKEGYEGDGVTCKTENPCNAQPCQNGGTCQDSDGAACQNETGCGDPVCLDAVCTFDSFCCNFWDANCAQCAAGSITTFADCTTIGSACDGAGYECGCPEGWTGLNCDEVQCTPSMEICDGKDNDCDGDTDEGLLNACGTCGALPTEICDGIDNNCDGTTDEGNPGGAAACDTSLQGVCADGITACVGGSIACVQTSNASAETCDYADNDCDGTIDNGVIPTGDSSYNGADFKDNHPGPTQGNYPNVKSGSIFGTIAPASDRDWFAVHAVEDNADFCITDGMDEDVKGIVSVTAPTGAGEWVKVCACWSTALGKCDHTEDGVKCATATNGATSSITAHMKMNCGSEDEGWLDIEVYSTKNSYMCNSYQVDWQIQE